MRTLLELYDNEAIENVLAAKIFHPETVVYLWDKTTAGNLDSYREGSVRRYLNRQMPMINSSFVEINYTNLSDVIHTLGQFVKKHNDCVIDFTGGRGILLAAATIVSSRLLIPSFYIDYIKGRFINIYGCEGLAKDFQMPQLMAKDLFEISGGCFYRYGHYNPEWKTEAFQKDMIKIWKLYRNNIEDWPRFVAYLQQAAKFYTAQEDGLNITAPVTIINERKNVYRVENRILKALEIDGILLNVNENGDRITFSFKDEAVKTCLIDYGICLELYVYVTALQMNYFDDVRISIVVDWDGIIKQQDNTINEIDLILTKGIQSIFISCKIGVPSPLDLSEISYLSRKFGGRLAKTVLVSASDIRLSNSALYQRAKDMGIAIIDRNELAVHTLTNRLLSILES